MKLRKVVKSFLFAVACILAVALLVIAAAFCRQAYINSKINDNYATVLSNPIYQAPVSVNDLHFIKQEISCGYAIIEMISNWHGKMVTEQSLFQDNNETISTAMGEGFLKEIKKQFPEWEISRHKNLKNSELLCVTYDALAQGMPVIIEFAALYETGGTKTWTLHFAVVTAMDLRDDIIIVQNPYGYEESYTVDSFLNATRYDSYDNMELPFSFGFAFGLFNKNSIYTLQK